ncbi:DUF3617 family protein [Qipengyuania gelatinilytica]|uniref:DUF3617 domain-containing protein n=1 Tax=Qipengyuania gelatinilytica TaxID=2867231 RepID=A0ABX8ZZT5_9SPHN|nr:DUF3617 family protein [Qipengyuania gelatinilytica]QZD94291.1 DUF3617 domain-containing protein [Qipengyuania gelatinilytica]
MKLPALFMVTASSGLLACAADQPAEEYLAEGLWETSVTMEEYFNPKLSESQRAEIVEAAQARQSTTSSCRPARENRLIPLVGDPFSMGDDSDCIYASVEASGEPANRVVKCTAPADATIELSGEVRTDFTDLQAKVSRPGTDGSYAVTREISRLVGPCPDKGIEQ